MSNLFTMNAIQIASNMVRKAVLTPFAKENEDADRAFVMGNANGKWEGTAVAVIGKGFQVGAPAKSVAKNAPLAEWIVEYLMPRIDPALKTNLVNDLIDRHAKAVALEANGVPITTGGSEQIKKVYANATNGIAGAESVLTPIGSTPKAPNSAVIGDVSLIFVEGGSTATAGVMDDESFAALERAYLAAAESREAAAPKKVAKRRIPKVKSATTKVGTLPAKS
jgi:hypothetical protein